MKKCKCQGNKLKPKVNLCSPQSFTKHELALHLPWPCRHMRSQPSTS